jgi:hypothetical protein
VGGFYGIGGGSLLAPILIALGFSVYEVAPATLAATCLPSIVGVATWRVWLPHATSRRPRGTAWRPTRLRPRANVESHAILQAETAATKTITLKRYRTATDVQNPGRFAAR